MLFISFEKRRLREELGNNDWLCSLVITAKISIIVKPVFNSVDQVFFRHFVVRQRHPDVRVLAVDHLKDVLDLLSDVSLGTI
jgi:hypothetical protein